MKLGLCTITRRADSLEAVCREAAEIGFEGIEVWGQPPHLAPAGAAGGAAAAAIVRAAGLEPAVYGSYLQAGTQWFGDRFDSELAAAVAYGAPMVRVWAAKTADADADEALWERTLADFRRLLEACGPLRICIERHGRTLAESLDGAQRLLEALPDDRLGLNYQYRVGADTEETLREIDILHPRIINVHAQSYGPSGAANLASGMLDYRRVLQALGAVEYNGYIEIEFVRRASGEPPANPDEHRALLEADYRYLRSCLG